jgi:hypothetical protein
MQQLDIPSKIVLPFAADGGRNVVPVDSLIGTLPGRASYQDGFPPLTRTPKASGGIPPAGLDMNGVMYDLSAIVRWANAGGGFPFDQTFADDANVGGYPAGARVMRSDGTGYWLNTVDDNTTDPESAGAAAAGWVPDFTNGAAAVTMTNANVTLTPDQYGKPIIVITGALVANLQLIFPDDLVDKWAVINRCTGKFNILAKTAGGSGVVVAPNGVLTVLISDGVDITSGNRTYLDVTVFGARGDGGDDWAAIQEALDTAAIYQCSVYFPAPQNKYCTSRPLVVDNGVILFGDSREKCLIEKTTTNLPSPALGIQAFTRNAIPVNYDYDQNAIVIYKKPASYSYPNGVGLFNLTLKAASGVTVDYGVYAPRLARSRFCDVFIQDVVSGWFTYDTFTCVFERIDIWDVSYGFRWANDGTNVGSGTSCTFIGCGVNFADIRGWYLYGLPYSSIIGCFSESISSATPGDRPSAWFFELCRGLTVFGCGSEVVKGYTFRISGGSVDIRGGDFSGLTGDTFGANTAVVYLDSGAKVSIGGGTRFAAVTSPGNIYNNIVLGSGALLMYDGTATRPSGGNTAPLFTGGGEIVVVGAAGEMMTRQDSTGTYYVVESSTSGTAVPTATWTLSNPTSGFSFPCVVEPTTNDRKLQWQNSSGNASGGWEFYASHASFSKIRLGVYNDGSLRISPPTATTVGAAGGASALPATPLGYMTISLDGTNVKIPYYNN